MGFNDETKAPRPADGGAPEAHIDDRYLPRSLTFAENVKLTIKVLAVAGLMTATLWGLSLWTAAK
jgi:hypothetical protein